MNAAPPLPPASPPGPAQGSSPWLFDATTDLWTFGGSALAGLLGVMLARETGWLEGPLPLWLWVVAVMGVDVAHVHSTWFRVYLDPQEFQRRRLLYSVTPVLCLVGGIAVHLWSPAAFWTVLAYIAVFHFIRQPYGFVALCRARAGETTRWEGYFDGATIYASTLWPVIWWHTRLPREFDWFVVGDFLGPWPERLADWTFPVYLGLLVGFGGKELLRVARRRPVSGGKWLVVSTTALSWYVGIVLFNSDVAFTLTNVLPHGIPYLVLIWHYGTRRTLSATSKWSRVLWTQGPLLYLCLLVTVAAIEEFAWDTLIWHDHPTLFGTGWEIGSFYHFVVPLLTVPQLTHYILDGFIWRRRSNPELPTRLQTSSHNL